MKTRFPKKNIAIAVVIILVVTSSSVVGYKTIEKVEDKNESINEQSIGQTIFTEELQEEINDMLNNNSSTRYLIISGGIRASSYFIKFPRVLTQRGLIFSGEIWYRSSLALTLVFEKNNSRFKLIEFERGTHRIFVFGIGHSTFSRPHWFSFGRLTAYTRIKPIII